MANAESSTSPAFQFYPNDFLSDANVIGMSLQERGAYITLLCLCWQQGTLPNDVDRLAKLCGAPVASFRKLWPALHPCFREHDGRLTNPRLEREKDKQRQWREKSAFGGRKAQANRKGGSTTVERVVQPTPQASGNQEPTLQSSVSSLQSSSSDFSQKTGVVVDARSKRPIFRGQRFVVFEWMFEDLCRMLGSHTEAFDLHSWFFDLDAQAVESDVVVPQRDSGKWIQEQTLKEAIRRGLPIAASQPANSKTAGNLAAAARFVARGQR